MQKPKYSSKPKLHRILQSANLPKKLEIEIRANATFTEPLEVSVDLPLGVSYVPQSLQLTQIPVGLEMEESHVSDLSVPIFQIKASATSPFNEGEKIVFSIEREADCLAINYAQSGGTFEDLIVVDFEGGSEQELGAPLQCFVCFFGFVCGQQLVE